MKIHNGIEHLNGIKNAIVTIGTFDGVHLGHQKILKRIIELAKASEGESVLVTFWPHPRFVLKPNDDSLKLLSTFDEKAQRLENLGIDHLVKIEFTKAFSQLSSQDFIQKVIIDALHTKKLVIGYDHRFGKNREGSFEHLKENADTYGFAVEEISRQDIDDVGISSTRIRNALNEGDIDSVKNYLGRAYEINGKVIQGDKIGRTIGFPTANIKVNASYKLIPADGTYAVRLSMQNKMYTGMLNIGNRPTVNGQERRVEVHIFDFEDSIYEEDLTIFFEHRLRPEKKFESIEELKNQLAKDKQLALTLLNK